MFIILGHKQVIYRCIGLTAISIIGLTLFVKCQPLVRELSKSIGRVSPSNQNREAMQPHLGLGPEERSRVSHLLQLEKPRELRLATCLHLMLLFGPNAKLQVKNAEGSAQLIDIITNSQIGDRFLQEQYLAKSKEGVHFTKTGPEAHRDQCLATLATTGIPLSQPVYVDGKTFFVSDMLNYSTTSFYINDDDLQWTLTAYSTYMSGVASWTNAFGQRYSLDDIIVELLSRPISEESCGGAHRLFALTRFILNYRAGKFKSSRSIQHRVEEYLHESAVAIANSQERSGAINSNWWSRIDPSNAALRTEHFDEPSLNITAHLAEWLTQLPPDLQGGQSSLTLARKWLSHEIDITTPDTMRSNLCPYTHAILACERDRY